MLDVNSLILVLTKHMLTKKILKINKVRMLDVNNVILVLTKPS